MRSPASWFIVICSLCILCVFAFNLLPTMSIPPSDIQAIEAHFDQMIRMQREKVLKMARRRVPHLTSDDILNPHDYPELMRDADFQFEDGVLGGLIQAQISLRAGFFRCRKEEA